MTNFQTIFDQLSDDFWPTFRQFFDQLSSEVFDQLSGDFCPIFGRFFDQFLDLEEDDITNQIEPLIEPNRSSWVGSVLNRVLPELKTSLNAEYDKERAELENEHRSRLQNLHSQHHHQQFELYEKNIKTHEQLQKLEEELEAKNRTISNFGKW